MAFPELPGSYGEGLFLCDHVSLNRLLAARSLGGRNNIFNS